MVAPFSNSTTTNSVQISAFELAREDKNLLAGLVASLPLYSGDGKLASCAKSNSKINRPAGQCIAGKLALRILPSSQEKLIPAGMILH